MLPEPLNTIRKRPVLAAYVFGVLLLLLGAWLWWAKLSTNPERVFWQTLDQSLATHAVTIQAEQRKGSAHVQQTVQYTLGATSRAHSLTTLSQGGTTIVNELVGTPSADYLRYVNIQTDQPSPTGKPLNFRGILGVWAKNGRGRGAQVLSQSVLGVGLPLGGVAIPIGNLPPAQRAALLKEIQAGQVYQTNYAAVKKQRDHGRLQYTYDVAVQPVAYARLMQRFAKSVGLHDLDRLNPATFAGQQALRLHLTIDVHARHMVAAEVNGVNIRQAYRSYDVPVNIVPPKQAIGLPELQRRLSHLQ